MTVNKMNEEQEHFDTPAHLDRKEDDNDNDNEEEEDCNNKEDDHVQIPAFATLKLKSTELGKAIKNGEDVGPHPHKGMPNSQSAVPIFSKVHLKPTEYGQAVQQGLDPETATSKRSSTAFKLPEEFSVAKSKLQASSSRFENRGNALPYRDKINTTPAAGWPVASLHKGQKKGKDSISKVSRIRSSSSTKNASKAILSQQRGKKKQRKSIYASGRRIFGVCLQLTWILLALPTLILLISTTYSWASQTTLGESALRHLDEWLYSPTKTYLVSLDENLAVRRALSQLGEHRAVHFTKDKSTELATRLCGTAATRQSLTTRITAKEDHQQWRADNMETPKGVSFWSTRVQSTVWSLIHRVCTIQAPDVFHHKVELALGNVKLTLSLHYGGTNETNNSDAAAESYTECVNENINPRDPGPEIKTDMTQDEAIANKKLPKKLLRLWRMKSRG